MLSHSQTSHGEWSVPFDWLPSYVQYVYLYTVYMEKITRIRPFLLETYLYFLFKNVKFGLVCKKSI